MVGGASKGLGLAVARALANEGARLSISGRNPSSVRRAAADLEQKNGATVLPVVADLRSHQAASEWLRATEEAFGGVDLLFANTGGPPPGITREFDNDAWQAAFELLVMSVVQVTRIVVPSMKARGSGSILIGASYSVKEPIPHLALSTVFRASVAALSKTLATELGPDNIRVNVLLPGYILTDRVRDLDRFNAGRAGISLSEHKAATVARIPLERYGAPAEFGSVAAFMLSDAASYVTGASLLIDGGLTRCVS